MIPFGVCVLIVHELPACEAQARWPDLPQPWIDGCPPAWWDLERGGPGGHEPAAVCLAHKGDPGVWDMIAAGYAPSEDRDGRWHMWWNGRDLISRTAGLRFLGRIVPR